MPDIQNSEISVPKKNPWIAFFLTILFPGLGHLYVGSRFAAGAYAAMTLGLGYSYFSAKSFLAQLAVLFIVPFVVIPAVRDAVSVARGNKKVVTGEESQLYVIWMLCCVGPFAIPLLWQNKKFSVPVKIAWTALIIAIAVTFIFFISALGKTYDELAQTIGM